MLNTLSFIADKLNKENIMWGVGASILLNNYGIIDKPKDIDILVHLKDIEKADRILKNIGEEKVRDRVETYSTKYFYEYVVNGFDVDVMSGLRINHSFGTFEYVFDHDSISGSKTINGVDIPLTSLEDWYVLYQLIPNREKKVEMIEKYLMLNGIKKPELLKRALGEALPPEVKDKVERILKL